MQEDQGCCQLMIHWQGGQHSGRCRKTMYIRQGVPTVAHLEQSYCGIEPELSNDDADHAFIGLIESDQVQR